MKLHKRLSVAGKPINLIDDDIRLAMFTPGRASFSVESPTALTGVVVFSCGYQIDKIAPWFIGYVESCTQVDKKQQRIFCRELSAALYNRLPLALRDVTMAETLAAISAETGLKFTLPTAAAAYLANKAAAFYNMANGYYALDCLADVYGVDKPIWLQLVDGSVFVGSWDHSPMATKVVDIHRDFENEVRVANGATISAILGLRPGIVYNGSILTDVSLVGLKMQLQWSANPWRDRV